MNDRRLPLEQFEMDDEDVHFIIHCLRLMSDQFQKDAKIFEQAHDMIDHTRQALVEQFRRQRDRAQQLADRFDKAERITVGKEVE